MLFYLGTHEVSWLARTDSPLFISRRRLARRKSLPRALGRWALDSGGFTELSMFGAWQTTPERYAEEAQTWMEQIGGMDWASQQDSMCEPFITEKTGRTVTAHQQDTVENYHQLVRLAPSVPWVPVLQGWEHDDYIRHLRMWESSGVDLRSLPRVGLGSVCRRQDTSLAEELIRDLHAEGIRIHGFGFKLRGLARVAPFLASSDSLAWSYNARRNQPLPECKHRKCSSCLAFAMRWRKRVDSLVGQRCADLSQKTLWVG